MRGPVSMCVAVAMGALLVSELCQRGGSARAGPRRRSPGSKARRKTELFVGSLFQLLHGDWRHKTNYYFKRMPGTLRQARLFLTPRIYIDNRGHTDRRAGAPGTRSHRAVREGVAGRQA